MKSLSSKTYQCGVTIQGLTTLSGTVYLTGITNTASWDHVIVGTTAQGQIYTRTYAQFMGDVATGISLSSYVTGSGTTNYLPKFTGTSALGNSQIFDNGTNVGIGTASPSGKLQIADDGPNALVLGSAQISTIGETNDGGYPGMKIVPYNSNIHIGISSTNDNRINLWHGGSNYAYWQQLSTYTIFSNYSSNALALQIHGGNVGIGTTTPTQKLEVNGSTWVSGTVYINRGVNSTEGYTYFDHSGTQVWKQGIFNDNTSTFSIGNGGGFTRLFNITNAGNVGIGTTSPSTKLDVIGTGVFGTLTSSRGSYSNGLSLQNNTGEATSLFLWQSGVASAHIGSPANSTSLHIVNSYNTGLITDPNSIVLTNTGNVGIGTTAPGAKLELSVGAGVTGGLRINYAASATGEGMDITYLNNGATTTSFDSRYNSDSAVMQFRMKTAASAVTAMAILGSGNIGIGTTSPIYKLHVSNNANGFISRFTGGASSDVNIGIFGYTGAFGSIGTESNHPLNIFTSGTDRMTISTSGNVGIGTTAPIGLLHLYKAASATRLAIDGDAGQNRLISYRTGAVQRFGLYVNNTAESGANVGSDFAVRAYNDAGTLLSTPLFIQRSTGNVGIGTTSPATSLQVNGTARATRLNSTGGIVDFDAQTGNNFIQITSSIVSIANGGNVNMTITSAGNVGIGTTTPAKKLVVTGASSELQLYSDSDISTIDSRALGNTSNKWLSINPNGGNVGIGTSTPAYKLDVSGALRATGTVYSDNGSLAGALNLGQVVSIGSSFGSYANLIFTMHNGGGFSDIMKLQGNGNVGIGTTGPETKLHVAGGKITLKGGSSTDQQIVFNYAREYVNGIYNSSGHFRLQDNSLGGTVYEWDGSTFAFPNGNIGIGTTSPSTKLDVNGVITATGGNSTNWNTAYGWGNHASASYVPQARTLTINGTSYDLSANRSWTITTTTAAGSDTQVQYNSSGTLAGASALIYNSTTNRVGINQASPGYDLDVNGQVRVQDKLRIGTGNGVVHMSSTATINASATTIVWAQNVSVGMCAFIEYYILNNNSLTDQRAGTIIVTWNQSGTPTITHTETTTPDIGSTATVNFTSSLVGSDARINAVNSSANPYTMVMSYKYF